MLGLAGARALLGSARPQARAEGDQRVAADGERVRFGRVGVVRPPLRGRRRLQERKDLSN